MSSESTSYKGMTMDIISNSFILLCVGISLLVAANSAFADTKQWEDKSISQLLG